PFGLRRVWRRSVRVVLARRRGEVFEAFIIKCLCGENHFGACLACDVRCPTFELNLDWGGAPQSNCFLAVLPPTGDFGRSETRRIEEDEERPLLNGASQARRHGKDARRISL